MKRKGKEKMNVKQRAHIKIPKPSSRRIISTFLFAHQGLAQKQKSNDYQYGRPEKMPVNVDKVVKQKQNAEPHQNKADHHRGVVGAGGAWGGRSSPHTGFIHS